MIILFGGEMAGGNVEKLKDVIDRTMTAVGNDMKKYATDAVTKRTSGRIVIMAELQMHQGGIRSHKVETFDSINNMS